jgi:hypothetical protein
MPKLKALVSDIFSYAPLQFNIQVIVMLSEAIRNLQDISENLETPLGKPRRISDDGIKIDLGKNGCGVWSGVNWLRKGVGGGML